MVVPGSAQKITEDQEHALYTVTVFQVGSIKKSFFNEFLRKWLRNTKTTAENKSEFWLMGTALEFVFVGNYNYNTKYRI